MTPSHHGEAVRGCLLKFANAIKFGYPQTHFTGTGERKSRLVTLSIPEEECSGLIDDLKALSTTPVSAVRENARAKDNECDGITSCKASKFDGVVCADDACDFRSGVRSPPRTVRQHLAAARHAARLLSFITKHIDAAEAALASQPRDGVTPDGWKLVPINPTSEMIIAGCENNPTQWNENTTDGFSADVANDVYTSMIAVSPPLTVPVGGLDTGRDVQEDATQKAEIATNADRDVTKSAGGAV